MKVVFLLIGAGLAWIVHTEWEIHQKKMAWMDIEKAFEPLDLGDGPIVLEAGDGVLSFANAIFVKGGAGRKVTVDGVYAIPEKSASVGHQVTYADGSVLCQDWSVGMRLALYATVDGCWIGERPTSPE